MFSILPLPELDILLITNYLDPYDDYKNLCQINKYYNELIKNNQFYKKLQEYHNQSAIPRSILCYDFELYLEDFPKSIYYGYLEIAEWLYNISIENNMTDDNKKIENIFGLACENGHKNVAEWLYDLYIKKILI